MISSFNLVFTTGDIYSTGFSSRFLWQTFRYIFYKILTLLKLIVFHWYIRGSIYLYKHRLHFEAMNLWLVSFKQDTEHEIAIVCTVQLHSAIDLLRILNGLVDISRLYDGFMLILNTFTSHKIHSLDNHQVHQCSTGFRLWKLL